MHHKLLLNGNCSNSIAYGWLPIGVHQIDVELKPGETKDINFILGYAENPVDKKFLGNGKIRKDEFEIVQKEISNLEKYRN